MEKKKVVFLKTKKKIKKKMKRYVKGLEYIAHIYNLKSDSDTSKKGEELKILTNKQMLNRLPIFIKWTRFL